MWYVKPVVVTACQCRFLLNGKLDQVLLQLVVNAHVCRVPTLVQDLHHVISILRDECLTLITSKILRTHAHVVDARAAVEAGRLSVAREQRHVAEFARPRSGAHTERVHDAIDRRDHAHGVVSARVAR